MAKLSSINKNEKRKKLVAKYAQVWNMGGSPAEFKHKMEILDRHCADVGRDPKDILLSAHLRLADGNYRRVIEDTIALGAEGLDLAIVYLPLPHDPRVVEVLAERIRDSGLWRGVAT